MGVLETALVVLGLAGMAGFTSLAVHFGLKRAAARREAYQPLASLAAQLEKAAAPLKAQVWGDTVLRPEGPSLVVEGVCDRLTLRREQPRPSRTPGSFERVDSLLAHKQELEVGDPGFDDTFLVLGPPRLVSALLDAETRRRLVALAGTAKPGATVVEHGVLTIALVPTPGLDSEGVRQRGHEVVEVARRLVAPPDVMGRLAANVTQDPLPGVRLRSLEIVLQEEPETPATRALLRAASADRDVDVRLRAAVALGEEGRAVLASVADDEAADDMAVENALQALGAHAPVEVVWRVLGRGMGPSPDWAPKRSRAVRASLAALANIGGPVAVSKLKAVLLASPPIADDAARALARIGGPAAEEALIAGLTSARAECRRAVVPGLAEMGTAAAVAPLLEAERHGGDLRLRARWAITQIQSRLTGEAGAVSLAGGESGQVSLAPDTGGQVSLPLPPRDGGAKPAR